MNSTDHKEAENCIFCKIVSGEIQAEKVYEDTETLAIMNINPTNKGQVLVMPKDHIENIYGFSEELAARIMLTTKKLSIAVKNGVDADGVNLIMNNEEAAGQVIFHAHMHIIPRFNDDGLEHWPAKPYLADEISEFGEKIKKEVL
ncbi:MAG: HIT family protein [bacterium]